MKKYAGILVRKDNKCLLCKRGKDAERFPNSWSFPSGHVEKGENVLDAAKREFYEETDLELNVPIYFLGVLANRIKQGTEDSAVYLFGADVDEEVMPDLENAQDGFEHSECGYFDLDNLPLPMTTNFREFLENLSK